MLVIDYSWKNRDKAEIKQSTADYHFQSSSPSFYEGWVGSYLTVPLLGGKQSSNHPGPNAINHCLPSYHFSNQTPITKFGSSMVFHVDLTYLNTANMYG